MALLALKDVSIAFGGPAVLSDATFAIERGERVSLVGRNGTGKSTLMKILDGSIVADSGEVVTQGKITVARLAQNIPDGIDGSVYDVVAEGLGIPGTLISRYHAATVRVATDHDARALNALDDLHRQLDAANAWYLGARVETAIQHLGLDPDAKFSLASGGRKRQTLLARALVSQPDVLLLDEPTNHLDVSAIEWMESYLVDSGMTLLFVTHDRAFLRNVATRIVELDRGRLSDWGAGSDYDSYVQRKNDALAVEAREWEQFDKKLAKEEVWIRTGIQARRTRNEGRVRALESLRVERGARRERIGSVRMQTSDGERSGKLVVEASDVSFSHTAETSKGKRPIIRDFSTTIMRGDRVGIIGPNGSGKTTLIKLLLGELEPDAGTIRLGTNIELAYFDQLRETLDPERSVFDSIADGADFVSVRGSSQHVHGYLGNFLFSPDRARTPVKALSGGERNRLMLARLFTRSFNLLVLDEPTNDLDIETLDLLEEILLEYAGTLILVSHDREFLDNIVSSTLVIEGDGRIGEYVGGYTDWIRVRDAASTAAAAARPRAANGLPSGQRGGETSKSRSTAMPMVSKGRKQKLSYKESAELKALPSQIDLLEAEKAMLYERMNDASYVRDPQKLLDATKRLAEIETEIESAMARWESLETISSS